MPGEWRQFDDLVNPYGDKRGVSSETVWTFDLDRDTLYFDRPDRNNQLPLFLLRERAITREDFRPYHPVAAVVIDAAKAFPAPYWRSAKIVLERYINIVSRMLRDFAYQWCHILRHTYNDITFRRLARAAICIATKEFQVIEIAGAQQRSRGAFVSNLEVLIWKPFDSLIVSLRTVR
jgi:hypothetical protein